MFRLFRYVSVVFHAQEYESLCVSFVFSGCLQHLDPHTRTRGRNLSSVDQFDQKTGGNHGPSMAAPKHKIHRDSPKATVGSIFFGKPDDAIGAKAEIFGNHESLLQERKEWFPASFPSVHSNFPLGLFCVMGGTPHRTNVSLVKLRKERGLR